MVNPWLIFLIVVIVAQRSAELYLAHRNQKWMLENGGKEFGNRHYYLFFLLHTGWVMGLAFEAYIRGYVSYNWYLYFGLFVFAQILRYWSIKSLGKHWNTRIIFIPGQDRIKRGPYRFFRHPNYIAVTLELMAVPMIFGAWITAVIASIFNFVLLIGIRIPAEEKAFEGRED